MISFLIQHCREKLLKMVSNDVPCLDSLAGPSFPLGREPPEGCNPSHSTLFWSAEQLIAAWQSAGILLKMVQIYW